MISGSIVSINISPKTVYVVEANVARGLLTVTNAFSIRNFDRFFSRGRLINMSTMVDAIAMSMRTNGIKSNRVMVCFNDAFETTFSIEPISSIKKKKNFHLLLKGNNENETDEENASSLNGATIKRRHSWGQYITQEDQGEAVSLTLAERDMVDSLVSAFAENGYKVLSLESPETVMIYVRNSLSFSYDYTNKIIIQSDDGETGNMYVMTKDVPSMIKRIQFDSFEGSDMEDWISDACNREANNARMRNPLVYLIGKTFQSVDEYINIADRLESEGMHVVDLYAVADNTQFEQTALRIVLSETVSDNIQELNCAYGLCMCQLLRCYDAKPESIYDGKLPSLFSTKNKLQAMTVAKVAAVLFMVFNLVLSGVVAYEAQSVRSVVQDSDNLRSQLTKVERDRDNAQTQLSVIGSLDPRIDEVFTFVLENVDSSINIASVDTIDMIPKSKGSTTNFQSAETNDNTIVGRANAQVQSTGPDIVEETAETEKIAPATEAIRKQIIIRGYSSKSSGPIELYNELTKAHIDEVKLSGHQQIVLPSEEIIYAFEIRVGNPEVEFEEGTNNPG